LKPRNPASVGLGANGANGWSELRQSLAQPLEEVRPLLALGALGVLGLELADRRLLDHDRCLRVWRLGYWGNKPVAGQQEAGLKCFEAKGMAA
jgi:hypothetical protein